jgi:hypothetical protein
VSEAWELANKTMFSPYVSVPHPITLSFHPSPSFYRVSREKTEHSHTQPDICLAARKDLCTLKDISDKQKDLPSDGNLFSDYKNLRLKEADVKAEREYSEKRISLGNL